METHQINPDMDYEPNQEPGQQLQPGAMLVNRYLIQRVVGVGGMGAVYCARDMHFPNVTRQVAVKEMVIQVRDPLVRKSIVQNFEREANLLATLNHNAIPPIFDYFTINERSYLVLEFVHGKDLEAIISETPGFLSTERVVGWAIELCDVLHFLHTHKPDPIVFRDMKPSNIMINPLDRVVLVDFGIAKPFQGNQKGTMIGTEGYSPPEQYRGESSPLVDIYALGATLHHALSRRDPRLEPPFSFGERNLRELNPAVTPELQSVVVKALQYEPIDRFQSAMEMKEALLDIARQSGRLSQAARSSAAKEPAVERTQGAWTFQCEDEIRGAITYADDNLYVGCYDNNLYALRAQNGEFVWKYPTDGGVVSRPAVQENTVYIGSEDGGVHAVSTRTGKVIWSYFTKGPVRSSPSIAEGHIFIGSDDGQLYAINALTGRRAWQTDAGSPIRSTPFVTHEYVYFGTEAGDLYSVDFSGAVKWRFNAKRGITSSPVVNQGVVFFGSLDSSLYALDAKTGWLIWRARLGKPSISSPCLAGNLLFTGAADGVISCYDANSSKEVWRFETKHQVTGSPIIYKDSLYCGSVDGYLYCLEYRTGRLRWKYKTGGPITGTPVAGEDLVFIGSTDHHIYALKT